MKVWSILLSLCLCLSACGGPPAEETPAENSGPAGAAVTEANPGQSPSEATSSAVLTCRIVDGAEEGSLLLAELGEGLYGGAGVYRLNVQNLPVTLDGIAADASVLEDGMPVDISFNGTVMESFPAQLGEVSSISAWSRGQGKNSTGTTYDLCGLYLQVLDDLWQKDPGLNENISTAGLDLSRAPGELTESEKAALAWRFGETHGVEVVTGTFEELKEQGYFTAEPLGEDARPGAVFLHWEDGCLFSIEPNEAHAEEVYSLPTLFFNAEKWRSSLGAYTFYDCSAMWPQGGTWTGYQIGSEMIS